MPTYLSNVTVALADDPAAKVITLISPLPAVSQVSNKQAEHLQWYASRQLSQHLPIIAAEAAELGLLAAERREMKLQTSLRAAREFIAKVNNALLRIGNISRKPGRKRTTITIKDIAATVQKFPDPEKVPLEEIAQKLGVHERTLERVITANETSWSELRAKAAASVKEAANIADSYLKASGTTF